MQLIYKEIQQLTCNPPVRSEGLLCFNGNDSFVFNRADECSRDFQVEVPTRQERETEYNSQNQLAEAFKLDAGTCALARTHVRTLPERARATRMR